MCIDRLPTLIGGHSAFEDLVAKTGAIKSLSNNVYGAAGKISEAAFRQSTALTPHKAGQRNGNAAAARSAYPERCNHAIWRNSAQLRLLGVAEGSLRPLATINRRTAM